MKKGENIMRAVAQYDLDGNLIKIYDSIISAANSNNLRASNISNCCQLKQRTSGGYQWRYYEIDNFLLNISPIKSVIQYTRNGTYVNTFTSMAKAAKATKIDHSAISRCCRGELKTAGGYVWEYKKGKEKVS
jgi:hypothetical protein